MNDQNDIDARRARLQTLRQRRQSVRPTEDISDDTPPAAARGPRDSRARERRGGMNPRVRQLIRRWVRFVLDQSEQSKNKTIAGTNVSETALAAGIERLNKRAEQMGDRPTAPVHRLLRFLTHPGAGDKDMIEGVNVNRLRRVLRMADGDAGDGRAAAGGPGRRSGRPQRGRKNRGIGGGEAASPETGPASGSKGAGKESNSGSENRKRTQAAKTTPKPKPAAVADEDKDWIETFSE
jgi:hypothetical protein